MTALEVPPAVTGGLHLLNTSPAAQRDVLTHVQPFAIGTYRGEPLRLVGPRAQAEGNAGIMLQSSPMGARWPDGSFRYALVHVPVSLAANERVSLRNCIEVGGGEFRPFVWTPAAIAAFKDLQIALQVGEKAQSIRAVKPVAVEDGHLSRCYRWTLRVPGTPMAFEVHIEWKSGLDHAAIWIEYSPFAPPAGAYALPSVKLLVHGAHLELRHANAKVLDYDIDEASMTSVFTLLRATPVLTAGGGQAMKGVLLFPNGDKANMDSVRRGPILGVATTWRTSKAFGIWGNLPELPAALVATAATRAKSDYAAHKIGDPWCTPVLGPIPMNDPEDESPDMPTAVMLAEASGIAIERLLAVERSVLQRACIPNGYRDEQGNPIPFSKYNGKGKPNMVWWEGNIHSSSSYMLGLSSAPPKPSAQGFGPEDDEHDQCGYAGHFAMLTGDRWTMRYLTSRRAEVQIQCMRTDTGNPVVDNLRAARAEGRQMRVAFLLWLVTGRDDLRESMQKRLAVCRAQWNGKFGMAHRPLKVLKPSAAGHRLGNPEANLPCWSWEEIEGVAGLAPAIDEFGNAEDADMLWALARSAVTYGQDSAPPDIYNAVEYRPNGAAGGAIEKTPPGFFASWAIPANQVAQREAKKRGDTATAAKAGAYLAQLASSPPTWDKAEYASGEAGGDPSPVLPE